jgi:hypothetical protein
MRAKWLSSLETRMLIIHANRNYFIIILTTDIPFWLHKIKLRKSVTNITNL